MSAPALDDLADRLLIRQALDDTVLVEAAAGTGKTTELVKRILNVLAQGRARIDQIVAVTFTEKAAGELKLRIRQELEQFRETTRDPQVMRHLTDAIQRLEEAHVSTIHGFCADLLRERPVEAAVDPLFDVLSEGRADAIYEEAFQRWLADHLETPPEGVRRALRRSVWSRDARVDDDAPIQRLARAGRDLVEWRDLRGSWQRAPFDRDGAIRRLIDHIHQLADLTSEGSPRDPLFIDTGPVRELSHDIRTAERLDVSDLDGWEARLVDLAHLKSFRRARRGREGRYKTLTPRDIVWTAYQATIAELDDFERAADCDLAAKLNGELYGVVTMYEELKRQRGALDYVDLLLRARDLLVGDETVRCAFQNRFTHLFVDEFQDTDPLQAEVLLLLAAADASERDWTRMTPLPGKLFIVGDPKQAIYRFRRADVETYRDVRDRLLDCGARPAYLRTSFRATPTIQHAINAAFAPLMTGDRETLQAEYVRLSPYRPDPEHPSVVVLPVPEPYGHRRVAGYAIDESLPGAVGAFVHWLVSESGWTVSERTGRDELPMAVPVHARHVCILFRRFLHLGEDVTRRYVDALEARGVRHLLVGGKSFYGREEVETLRSALAAIEWPDDELSVFATLRGALFAIGDEALLEYRHGHGGFHPFRAPRDLAVNLQPIGDALELLRRLHSRRNHVPVADTITELLEATRAHVGFVLRPAGEQALANVLHIAELARRFELEGGLSFRAFVERLQKEAEGGQGAEAPVLEEGTDGVRLMTVHKAKGLEFPVVILADITAKLKSERADRSIDRQRHTCYLRLGRWAPIELLQNEPQELERDAAEGVRVAYVAATRARDLLVVPAVGDAAWEGGWTGPLNAAIYPGIAERRLQTRAPGCPPFKSDSVWRRPDNDPATAATVCPGLHLVPGPTATPHGVVWWDPHALQLRVDVPPGIVRESLIVKDLPEAAVNADLAAYDSWRRSREQAIRRGSEPSLSVRTATEWAAEPPSASTVSRQPGEMTERLPTQQMLFEDQPARHDASAKGQRSAGDIEIVDVRGPSAAGGARFGELVHALLAVAPLAADPSVLESLAEVQGRILSAPLEEVSAAAVTVERVLAHPLLVRARAAGRRCRREAPVTLTMSDGTLVEGVVDLAFEESGRWVVVDYKTDRELTVHGEERYRRQLGFYMAAISASTGSPATGYLLRI